MPVHLDCKYEYGAEILRVIDGDTVVIRADCGFHVFVVKTVRLAGIDCPEIRGAEKQRGRDATSHLKTLIEQHSPLTVRTLKDRTGKYGRFLARLIGRDGDDLNQKMVDDGFAVLRD